MYTWNAGLKSLQPYDFQGARSLRNIDLSQNNITALIEATFFGAIDLEYINLATNQIDRLPKLTFHGLVHLRVLRLDGNRIRALDVGMFDVLPSLQMLYANDNRIDYIAAALFALNAPLQEVHLQRNSIHTIDGQPFGHLRQLNSFRVDDNPVRRLECLQVDSVETNIRNVSAEGCVIGKRTRTLLAAHNRIGYVIVTEPKAAIERLELQSNNLRSFANLSALHALRDLDVSDNRLADLDVPSFAHMPHLRELRLRHSGLRSIAFGLVSHKPHLRWLDVAHNRLGSVELIKFTGLPELRALFLEGNRLTHIQLAAVRQFFPALQTIGLAQNPWNCTNLAAAVKVLEANQIELNSVGLARNRTNIRGIPCEARPLLGGFDSDSAEGIGAINATETFISDVANLGFSDALSTYQTTTTTGDPTTEASVSNSDPTTSENLQRLTADSAHVTCTSGVYKSPGAVTAMRAQLVALEWETRQAAERAAWVAAVIRRMLADWTATECGEEEQ